MVYSLLPAVIGNILNAPCGSLCRRRCYILYIWFGLWFLMYKRVVSRNLRNTVVKLRPYPLEFMSYSVWRRRIGRKGRNPKKTAKEVFYALEPLHLEEWLAFVCVQPALYTHLFHSPMLHSVARMLAVVIHCITVYKQPSPSLHRQGYCAIWCVGVMSCTLSCLPARAPIQSPPYM